MKFLPKIAVQALFILTLSLGGFLVSRKHTGTQLATQLEMSRQAVRESEAAYAGLEQVNHDLWGQMDRLRSSRLTIMTNPLPENFPTEERQDQLDQTGELFVTSTALTLAQEAAGAKEEKIEADRIYQEFAQEWRKGVERQRKEKREQMVAEVERRKAFFSRIPLEGLAPEYRESNQQLLAEFDAIQMMMLELDKVELNSEEGRALFRQSHEKIQKARGLMNEQREVLLYDFAQMNLGLDAEQTQAFITYMEKTNQMTNMATATSDSLSEETRQALRELRSR